MRLRDFLPLLAFGTIYIAAGCPGAPVQAGGGGPQSAEAVCTVARITDGDTLVCDDDTRVRLLLIDTPEMNQGEFGRLARQYLVELAPPGTVLSMEYDVEREDRYGRALAYLYAPDGRMINEAMAHAGYAVVLTYPPNVRHVERIRAAVESAREAGVGLWATSAFDCLPVEHRRGRCERE